MKFNLTLSMIAIIVYLNSSKVAAEDVNSTDTLLSLSLEQLQNIKVTIASKFEESVHDAHASISIVTKEQIDLYGANYLYEVLERIVNVNSTFGVLTSISTRGSVPWTSLSHHLVLINGRPFGNHSGGHGMYSSIPLRSVERIEYIRGPGSVLYGTNAYHGVINIVTKTKDDLNSSGEIKTTFGSYGTKLLDGTFGWNHNDVEFIFSFLSSDSSGWNADMYDPEQNTFYSKNVFQNEQTIHFDLSYKNLTLSHYNNQQEKFANFWDAPQSNYLPWTKDHKSSDTNLTYKFSFNNFWRAEAHAMLNKKTLEWDSNGLADEIVKLKFPVVGRLLELNLFGDLSSTRNFLAGITYENRRVHQSYTVPDASEYFASLYWQYQDQLNDSLSYSVGGQYVTSTKLMLDIDNKSDFVPRFGVIYDVNEELAIKFLYAQAYRQPTIGERLISSPNIQKGSPNLESELITTSEFQLYYESYNGYLTITYYQSFEKNLIVLVPSDDPNFALENRNLGERKAKGFEFEGKYFINDNWQLEYSWAYQTSKNESGVDNTTLMPNNSGKLGIGYNDENWQFGLFNIYLSDFHDTNLANSNTIDINPKAKSFNWLTFKAQRKLTEFDDKSRLFLAFEVKNGLNEKIYYPNDTPVFYPSNTLPGREGRSFFLSFIYQ